MNNVDKIDRGYWEEIFVMPELDKGLIYRMYKDFL